MEITTEMLNVMLSNGIVKVFAIIIVLLIVNAICDYRPES